MQKTGLSLALISVVVTTSLGWSAPIQRKHRPWMMVASAPTAPAAPEVERVITTPRPVVTSRIPRYKRIVEPTGAGTNVAKQALKYKGTRYKFGGTSKKGLDCSGLVARVYEDLKLKKIPRASNALYKSGQPVKLAELRPGDLVFFKNTYKHGISHVGVYAGHNKFVHAANRRRGVTVTPLSDPYYQLHYAGARRLY